MPGTPPGPGAVGQYWAGAESVMAERRELVSYIQAKLKGAEMTTYDIQTRRLRQVLIYDQRNATADTLVCDLTIPVK